MPSILESTPRARSLISTHTMNPSYRMYTEAIVGRINPYARPPSSGWWHLP